MKTKLVSELKEGDVIDFCGRLETVVCIHGIALAPGITGHEVYLQTEEPENHPTQGKLVFGYNQSVEVVD